MGAQVRGLIEGFYGRPWSWDERVEVLEHCHARGMTHYVYAPKDDPLHRERWREPYTGDALTGFDRLVAEGGLEVGFGISPGLSMDYRSEDDRAALAAKVDQVVERGIGLVCLALDDIPVRPGLGEDHAALTAWLRHHLDGRATLILCPTEYTGTTSTPYLESLAEAVPADVAVAWTGATVLADTITAADAHARADALGGRPPLVWDNFPVNDATMSDQLFLGPLRGRDPAVLEACSGWLANPMVQPRASRLPLASVAAFLRGDDPRRAWEEEAEVEALRVFAEACDGAHPNELVGALIDADSGNDEGAWSTALQRLREWMSDAATCGSGDLADEARTWLDQTHREAELGLTAVRVLERLTPNTHRPGPPDPSGALEHGLLAAVQWQGVRRGAATVMGPRLSVRPVIAQDRDGAWVFDRASVVEDGNAVDALVRLAFDVLARRR